MKYIIEQFGRVYKWHLIEYKHISRLVGKPNLIFTNVKSQAEKLRQYGKVYTESVAELGFKNLCILDPNSDQVLETTDCKKFDYLVFGGILGDFPPRKRTKDLLTSKLPQAKTRNLGNEQFPTDNAVYVADQIAKGKKFEDIEFESNISLPVSKQLSIELPFRYAVVDGKPLISEELVTFLKKRKTI